MKKYKRKYNTPEYRKKYTGIYGSWYAMKQRCHNPNNKSFKNYGGRKIDYCPKWETFDGFKEDMGGTYKKGLFIERIDNNQGYFKENCVWATKKQNNNNKRSNIVLEYQGKKMPIAYWAEYLGINFGTLRNRFYKGMPLNKILAPRILNRWDK